MNSAQCRVSSCSRCRFYDLEGRRGGQCSQLGVPVKGRWTPCSLAMPVFEAALVEMRPLDFLPQPIELKELKLSEVFRETAMLEAALGAPFVPGRKGTIPLEPASIRLRR